MRSHAPVSRFPRPRPAWTSSPSSASLQSSPARSAIASSRTTATWPSLQRGRDLMIVRPRRSSVEEVEVRGGQIPGGGDTQQPADHLGVEPVRVERARSADLLVPEGLLLVLRMARIGHGVQEERVAVDAADILRRAGARPVDAARVENCLLYTSPSPRDGLLSRMPSSA